MNLFLIIPTYNESENLPALAEAVFALAIPSLSILVVDDNSPDGTGRIADELAARYSGRLFVHHRPGKIGFASAYTSGFRIALDHGADVIGQMDCDFSHPPEKISELLKALDQADIAVGSRYIPGGSLDRDWPIWRKALSRFGNWYARSILSLPLRDVTGGFRLWKRAVLEALPLEEIRSNGYVFQVEMAYVAHRMGFQFGEVPFYFAERRFGSSKMNLRIQLEAAFRVWQLPGIYRRLRAALPGRR